MTSTDEDKAWKVGLWALLSLWLHLEMAHVDEFFVHFAKGKL